MAKKPSITTIASGYYSRNALNTNFENLRDKFDNTLSLDGSTPNAMQADLDMNSNDILNAGEVNVNALTIDGVAVFPNNTQLATTYATQNYTGNGSTTTYAMGFNPATKANVDVYIDGVYQNQDAFNITGTNLTFTAAPPLNSAIEIKVPVNLTGLVASDSSQVTYNQGGTGAQTRTVQSRLRDFVSVKDFGAVGDGVTDDTGAFQAAADVGGSIHVPKGTYKIVGEVIFGSNTTVDVANGAVFTIDCSGQNGRGFYFEEAVNSGIRGDFIINASATSLGTDGSKNSCIQFGNASDAAAPSITQFCFATGNIEINISGSQNVKAIYLNGWVEDTILDGVIVTGKTNFAITSHWSSDTFPTLPTKTWHAHNLTVRNCKIYQKAGFDKPLRGFTFSAAGRVVVDNCYADCTTLGYNLFVGDYGYTYAQNLTQDEGYDFAVRNCYMTGEGGMSVDAVSNAVLGSPVWNGFDHAASVLVDGLEVNANDHSTGLIFGITGLDTGIFKNIKLYSDNVTHTREFFYPQLCNSIQVVNSTFKHHRFMRLRTTTYATVDGCQISKPVATPDVTTYSITLDDVAFADITNSVLKDARVAVFSSTDTDKAVRIVGNTFENVGSSCVDMSYTSQLLISNNTIKDCGTTTTSVNINCFLLDTDVTGFVISNNVFSTNDYRYLISTSATTKDGSIVGNAFLDLNTGATNPAGILIDGSAENIMISGNVTASGINLQYPITTSYTIASGAITVTDPRSPVYIIVDTEGGAATDDLDTINGGYEDQVVIITTSSDSRDVTFKDGTGNLQLDGDFLADNNDDTITLIKRASTWFEFSRSNNQ